MSAREILEAVTVVAELTGTQLSDAAKAAMVEDLLAYPEQAVMVALGRCRRELTGRLTPAAIIERMEGADGRPTGNEAWAIALQSSDESATVVWNDEIAEAMGEARAVLNSGDDVGARMAFRDAYDRIVRERRQQGRAVVWYPSLGHDPNGRVDAVERAVTQGRLTQKQASAYLPAPMSPRGQAIAGLLTGQSVEIPKDPEFRERIKQLLAVTKKGEAA